MRLCVTHSLNKENDLMVSLVLCKDVAELHYIYSQGAILDRYRDAARSIFLYGYKRSFVVRVITLIW